MPERVHLSTPHLGGSEFSFVENALKSSWIGPKGEYVTRFEQAICQLSGSRYAVALNCGTAGLHLALRAIGIKEGDEVICPTFSFVAPINAVLYLGAKPILMDSSPQDWHMDIELLDHFLKKRALANKRPKAIIATHIYGACGDIEAISTIAQDYQIPLIEDAAEALGVTYKGKAAGSFGDCGIYSFNGNKIITTSAGGMIITGNEALAKRCSHLGSQARVPGPCFEHDAVGYNYAMSNILAALGLGQLDVLEKHIKARQNNFHQYQTLFSEISEICPMPVAEECFATHWLSCFTIKAKGPSPLTLIEALAAENIEARTLWKPIHAQQPYKDFETIGGSVSEDLFQSGICLPSSSSLCDHDRARVATIIKNNFHSNNELVHRL